MYKFIIRTEYSFKPIMVFAYSYKIKNNFLTLNLKTNTKIVYNLNKIESFEVVEDVD